jgi:hypothetical protein
MLSLDSPRWAELRHAYGAASDTPELLRQLHSLPDSSGESEPWHTLWSSLAHQGDVYPASFAAVPHVIRALAAAPAEASFVYFQFPAWVEICRRNQNIPIPHDLEAAYYASLAELPALVAAASARVWDANLLACALSAIAAAKGSAKVAEAAMELSPDGAETFLQWLSEQ